MYILCINYVSYRPKHPVKVTCWAGISCRGTTDIVIFDGIMTASCYVEKSLVPFIQKVYPEGHRFMQDNDSKHTSRLPQSVFEEECINWWRTPPESPDCNPIENLWHELKEFNTRVVKPKKKHKLVDGIHRFWGQVVTVEKCQKYYFTFEKGPP